jgi:hypothetical protein
MDKTTRGFESAMTLAVLFLMMFRQEEAVWRGAAFLMAGLYLLTALVRLCRGLIADKIDDPSGG